MGTYYKKSYQMKNTIIAIALIVSGVFTSCNNDAYEEPNVFADTGWYTSALRQTEINVGIDQYMSFSDLSQGTVNNSWTISSGNFFLKGPINRQDSIFDSFIINKGDTVTNDRTIHVLFKKSGLQTVRLYNTFNDSVAFRGNDTIPAVKIGDKWVMDKTFVIDVYDTIVPAIEIRQDGVLVDHTNPLDTIYIEAGGSLDFSDVTTIGRPNTWNWNVGGATNNEQEATLIFKKLGIWEGNVNLSRTGQNIPGDWENYQIPINFKVIPSSQPFVVSGAIKELEDQTIQVPFNGEFAPFTDQESFFTVHVNGNPFAVDKIEINEDDATILDIKLVDQIYESDDITISYDGMGSLESTDTRKPVAFSDLSVASYSLNVFDINAATLEDGGASASWVPSWEDDTLIEVTTDNPHSGEYSLKLTFDGEERNNALGFRYNPMSNGAKFILEADKTYIIEMWLYIEPGGDYPNFWPHIIGGQWKGWWTDASAAIGQWTKFSYEYAPGALKPASAIMLRIPDETTDKRGVMYFDDFVVKEKDIRP